MPIPFYSTRGPYGCFSNFSRHGFALDGAFWPTSEHYFQAQKFEFSPEDSEAVRRAPTARDAARMGRERQRPLRSDWEHAKDDVMRRAVRAKFAAHPGIRAILLGTGDEEIIEASPTDAYWGAGADGTGGNMLGRILMETRAALRVDILHANTERAGDMLVADLPPEARMRLRTLRYDNFIEKHEGPESWEYLLTPSPDYPDYRAEVLDIAGFPVLLPVPVDRHANLDVKRLIPSADGQYLTIILADYTYAQPGDTFEGGRLAICRKLPGTPLYVAFAFHEMFQDETVLWE